MNPDADLSPPGIAATIASFLEALDLEDVTIVGNDSGGAMSQVLVTRHPERIGRLVLTNCDTHENFPPGIFKAMPPLAKLPGGMTVLAAPFRIGALARAAFKPFAKTPIPAELIASWMEPGLNDPGVKRDLQEGHRRDEQALHAGGGREAARLASCRSCSPGRRATSSSRSPTRNGSPAKSRNARHRRDPRREHLRPARPAAARRRRDRARSSTTELTAENAQVWGVFSLLACFSSDRGAMLP